MAVVNQPASTLDDACILCNVFIMDALHLLPSLRGCCKVWSQSLPKYTKPFGKALRHLRRLAVLRSVPLYQGSNVAPIRRELRHLSLALNWSQSSSVPNLLWQHQRLWWRYLKMSSRLARAWTVRQKAALILHDLGTRCGYRDIERKLVDFHEEAGVAWERMMRPEFGLAGPGLPVYEARRGLPLKFQTIQLNAALVAQEIGWLTGSSPRWDYDHEEPINLTLEHVPPTPEMSSDMELTDTEPVPGIPRNPFNYRVCLMGPLDRVYC